MTTRKAPVKKTVRKKAAGKKSKTLKTREKIKKDRIDLYAQARVAGQNLSDSYRISHPHCLKNKWKPETVHNNASSFEKLSEVQARIAELKAEQKEKYNMTIEKVIRQLTHQAGFNPKDLFNDDGSKKKIHELSEETLSALSLTETEDGVTWHFKASDRNKALAMIGDFYQMWSENIVHTGAEGGAIKTEHTVIFAEMPAAEASRLYKERMNAD